MRCNQTRCEERRVGGRKNKRYKENLADESNLALEVDSTERLISGCLE